MNEIIYSILNDSEKQNNLSAEEINYMVPLEDNANKFEQLSIPPKIPPTNLEALFPAACVQFSVQQATTIIFRMSPKTNASSQAISQTHRP